ncbi:hypothetical protein ACHAXA_004081 [Cyclostephanos tholiformis]|jgi:hypothetical protein|uniref:Pectinesterase inhibitor domain-containing protein n=1 Tax=Cyclostephanos tholiformis TaxID=382380 RepID=A0ABD3RF80_9STRA
MNTIIHGIQLKSYDDILSSLHSHSTLIYVLSLIRATKSFVHSSSFANSATQRRSGVDGSHEAECITCPNLLTACQFKIWHKFCDDVDKVLESLVSPAPESFHVLHSLITKINDEVECFDEYFAAGKYTNDLRALSNFLTKAKYTTVLFLNSGSIRWKIEHECSNSCNDIQECTIELNHKHNILESSRMA